jgi:hypothetical protein
MSDDIQSLSAEHRDHWGYDDDSTDGYIVTIQANLTFHMSAASVLEAARNWREFMQNEPAYIEDLYNNAFVVSIQKEG